MSPWILLLLCVVQNITFIDGQNCSAPPQLANAKVTRSDQAMYAENETVIYSCDQYYELSGVPSLQCINSTWSSTLPSCDQLNCSDVTPPTLNNGYYTGIYPYMGGDTIEYHCNTNFVISGNTILTCDNSTNTTWLGELPLCTPVCPSPKELPHAIINSDPPYYEGTYARYICTSHHVMSGDPYVTCGSDFTWQGEGPVCSVFEKEEVTQSEETLVFDTANEDTNRAVRLAAIIIGVIFAILLLLLLILLLLRICCRRSACYSHCFGLNSGGCCMCCKRKNDLHPISPRREKRMHLIESQDEFEPQPQPVREKRIHVVESQQQVQNMQKSNQNVCTVNDGVTVHNRERFQLAVERVMGMNKKNKTPKKIEGVWMPHANNVRSNHLTSTK